MVGYRKTAVERRGGVRVEKWACDEFQYPLLVRKDVTALWDTGIFMPFPGRPSCLWRSAGAAFQREPFGEAREDRAT